MSASSSYGFAEAAELSDAEAARLAQQIASERFLPISARHYESYLELRRRGGEWIGAYTRADLEAVWISLLQEAMTEVETIRNPSLVRRLQAAARGTLAQQYPTTAQPAQPERV